MREVTFHIHTATDMSRNQLDDFFAQITPEFEFSMVSISEPEQMIYLPEGSYWEDSDGELKDDPS